MMTGLPKTVIWSWESGVETCGLAFLGQAFATGVLVLFERYGAEVLSSTSTPNQVSRLTKDAFMKVVPWMIV
jgi:hypothetical protein